MTVDSLLELITLAKEDIDTGQMSSVYVDGPGWFRIVDIRYESSSGVVLLTLPDDAGYVSAPWDRVGAIKATPPIA